MASAELSLPPDNASMCLTLFSIYDPHGCLLVIAISVLILLQFRQQFLDYSADLIYG